MINFKHILTSASTDMGTVHVAGWTVTDLIVQRGEYIDTKTDKIVNMWKCIKCKNVFSICTYKILYFQGDKGDKGDTGAKGLKGHPGYKGDQVDKLHFS